MGTRYRHAGCQPKGTEPHRDFLRPRREVRRPGLRKAAAKDHLYLADTADAEDAQDAIQRDFRLGLFPGFTRGTLLKGLAMLQIPRGKGPEAAARLDRTAAHQHTTICDDHRAHDDFWIVIGYMAAISADHALTVITFGNTTNEFRHPPRIARSPRRINPRRASLD